MPFKTWDTKADFDGAYDIGLEPLGRPNDRPERRGGYVRESLFNQLIPYLDSVTPEWKGIIAQFGWPPDTSICILGCGFGWSIEYLNFLGYMDVWGVDNSQYIQGAKDEIDVFDVMKRSGVSSRIHDADLSQASEVARFLLDSGHRSRNGERPFDVCITERILTSLTDGEAVAMSADLRSRNVVKKIGGQIIHIESPTSDEGDPSFNWHTLEEWKALLPNDTIVRSGGKEFL